MAYVTGFIVDFPLSLRMLYTIRLLHGSDGDMIIYSPKKYNISRRHHRREI